MTTINSIFLEFKSHLKRNLAVLIWVAIFCLIGLIVGLILLFGDKSYLSLLTTKNQNLLGYISGSTSIFANFFSRIAICIFALMIIWLFCLNYFSSFFAYIYFAYQSAICTIVCGTLISYQGFAAVINSILIIIPSNIVLLSILAIVFSSFKERAKNAYVYKQSFAFSFKQSNFTLFLALGLLAILALNIVFGLVFPLILKGIYLIYY